MAPHRFPFSWRGRTVDGRLRVRLTQGDGMLRGAVALPATLALEILAQGAMTLLVEPGQDPENQAEAPVQGFLAAIDDARLPEPTQALCAGETLIVEVRRRGGLGRLLRLEGSLWRGDEQVASARLTVARG